MKRIKIVGLSLVAVFAMSALAAGNAAAIPTYKTCHKESAAEKVNGKYTGTWVNKTCSKAATPAEEAEGKKNKYRFGAWNEGKEANPKFKDANGLSELLLYTGTPAKVIGSTVCQKAKGEGKITGPSTSETVVVFEKCVSSGESCHSPGESAGKIKTDNLPGELAELSGKAIQRIGGVGIQSAEFECGAVKIKTTGATDAVDTGNVGVISKTSKNAFTTKADGEQENTVDGDILITHIAPASEFNSGESTTATLTGEEMMVEL
jgi:hypothetical protein